MSGAVRRNCSCALCRLSRFAFLRRRAICFRFFSWETADEWKDEDGCWDDAAGARMCAVLVEAAGVDVSQLVCLPMYMMLLSPLQQAAVSVLLEPIDSSAKDRLSAMLVIKSYPTRCRVLECKAGNEGGCKSTFSTSTQYQGLSPINHPASKFRRA